MKVFSLTVLRPRDGAYDLLSLVAITQALDDAEALSVFEKGVLKKPGDVWSVNAFLLLPGVVSTVWSSE